MEKNKNRTDLLAAGRKKLQQYRQKKDTKGSSSHGKSSHKNSKPGRDGDGATGKPSSSGKASKLETSSSPNPEKDSTDTSEPHFQENSVSLDGNVSGTDAAALPHEVLQSSDVVELIPVDDVRKDEEALVDTEHGVDSSALVTVENKDIGTIVPIDETEVVHVSSEETSLVSEEVGREPVADAELVPVMSLSSPVTVEEVNVDEEKESLPTDETYDISSFKEKQDLVKKKGAMQEADGSGSTQHDGSGEKDNDSLQDTGSLEVGDARLELEKDGRLDVSHQGEHGESPGVVSHDMVTAEEPTHHEVDGLSVPDDKTYRDELTLEMVGVPVSSETNYEAAGQPTITTGEKTELQPCVVETDEFHRETKSSSHNLISEGKAAEQLDMKLSGTLDEVHKQQGIPEGAVMVESQEKPLGEQHEAVSGTRTISLGEGIGSVDIRQLAKVLRGLEEEDLRFLLDSGQSTLKIESGNVCTVPDKGVFSTLESLKEQLYFAHVSKDVLHLHLAEQAELHLEFDKQDRRLLNEVSELRALLKESQDFNTSINDELGQCRSELQTVAAGREQLETQFLSARREVEEISARASELQTKLEILQDERTSLSVELVDCKSLLESLQTENGNLNGNLVVVMDENKKLESERGFLLNEHGKLSAQNIEHQERLAMECAKYAQLENDLKEAMVHLEQLTEENIFLSSSLDIHRTKVKEIENGGIQLLSQSGHIDSQLHGTDEPTMVHDRPTSDEYSDRSTNSKEEEVVSVLVNDSVGLVPLKSHFEEAEKIMQKLEMAIEGMQSHSASLSRSGGKAAAGVSKLIQAFESKVQHDESGPEELPLAEGGRSGLDSYAIAKEQTSIIRAVLKELDLNTAKANELFREEQEGRKIALNEFEILLEASKRHSSNLEAKNSELGMKLSEYQVKLGDLESQMCSVEHSSDKMAATIIHQLDNLQKEVCDRTATLENEWSSAMTAMSEAVQKLDASITGHISSTSLTSPSDALHVSSRFVTSVNAATEVIEDLHKKLQAAYIDHKAIRSSYEGLNVNIVDLHVRNEFSVGMLHTVYDDLGKLVRDSREDRREGTVDVWDEKDLYSNNYEALIGQLGGFLAERLQLKSTNNELETELTNRIKDIEELNKKCLDSKPILKLVEDIEAVADVKGMQFDSDTSEVSRLESLVALLIQKYTEASKHVSLSREEFESKETELSELLGKMHQLDSLNREHQQEIQSLKENIKQMDGFLIAARAELQAKETELQQSEREASSVREEFESTVTNSTELQDKMNHLNSLNIEHQQEIQILKENLQEVSGALEAVRSELQAKGAELEQSEHRVSSIREKLSIAVAKGKGLMTQRENLKQSLSDMSEELERCSQELQLKDSRLHEVETKLKTYSEAGERVEALESELSYIRNSATALRESFLVKDSALQRIEEILEDLELPEHFHSRDIIEKIEWLARSVSGNGNSLSMRDWEQKSSVDGGSYSDAGLVVTDTWKEDVMQTANPGSDSFRLKFEELQSKFYGLAEQNEMLEQSLMERNNLVQRWEEVLDRVDMPLQLRSMEPEDRIVWLGNALSDAHHDRDSLRQKIDNFEAYCGSITSELEESQKKVTDLEAALLGLTSERDLLSENLENLSHEQEKVVQYEHEKDELLNEITSLHEKMEEKHQNIESYHQIEEISRLQLLVSDALQDENSTGTDIGKGGTEALDGLLRKLIDKYMTITSEKSGGKDLVGELGTDHVVADGQRFEDEVQSKEKDIVLLKEKLEEVIRNVAHIEDERDTVLEKNRSLVVEFEALGRKNDDLQGRLSQEEQKLAATREKLNVAVRKGKALVQQRDSMKQTIEELSAEVESLKSKLNQRENTVVQYEQKIRDLSTYPEKVEALESERILLGKRLAETEHNWLDSKQTLDRFLSSLNGINFGTGIDITDPVDKLEGFGKVCHDLQATIAASENEAKKSKRAAELLLAELNEVQERSDGLQEELARVGNALADVSRDRDLAEAARSEALSRLEDIMTDRADERNIEVGEIMKLEAILDEIKGRCYSLTNEFAKILPMDMELIRKVEASMEALLKQKDGTNVVDLHIFTAPNSLVSSSSRNEVYAPARTSRERFEDIDVIEVFSLVGNGLQECIRKLDDLGERCSRHSTSSEQQANSLFKVMEAVCREVASQKESYESTRRDISHLELVVKEKDADITALRKSVQLLYETCYNSILDIENRKAQIVGNSSISVVNSLGDRHAPLTEESIKTIADTLLSLVKDSASIHSEEAENNLKELKSTIMSLRSELQEKDMQGNRVCAELVSQIKEAEAIAKSFSADLESSKIQLNHLEKQMEVVEKDRNALQMRVKEQQDREASAIELQERIRSLTEVITAKDQEIEALMQALDEEESQMEDLTNRNNELETAVQQKNLALENLEVSRGKAMAKLSTTVNKFDELHQLSESLLSEVENLQSQLQGRDAEISFLRQEVTKCTNDVLAASQEGNKRNSSEMHELSTWLSMMVSRLGLHDLHFDKETNKMQAYKSVFEQQITSILSEIEDLRVKAQSRDALLQVERSKVEELLHKGEALENSLHEKEFQLASLQGARDHGETTSLASSEITELEPMMNKRTVAGASITPHVRSMRKVNNDQVAVAIDVDPDASALDEDDDKVHGFKSLTTSRIVPRFTRPVSDMVDGLWVSCDRALMRQPALRLGIILYWIVVHSLLAASVV